MSAAPSNLLTATIDCKTSSSQVVFHVPVFIFAPVSSHLSRCLPSMESSSGFGPKVAIPQLKRPNQQTVFSKSPRISSERVSQAVSIVLVRMRMALKQTYSAIDAAGAVCIISNSVHVIAPTSCFSWTYCAS